MACPPLTSSASDGRSLVTSGVVRWQSARTASPAEARESITELYSTTVDFAATSDRRFGYGMSAAEDDTVSVAALRFEGRCRSGAESFDDVVIAHAVRGSHRWRVGEERGIGSVPFMIPPGVELRVEFTSAHIRTVKLDAAYVQDVAESLSGSRDGVFRAEGVNTRRRHPGLVAEALASLETMMAQSSVRDSALVRAQVRRHAVVSILSSFPLVELDRQPDRGIQSRRVRLAVAFMEAHAHEPITVGDIAIASATTTRSLQSAFRRAYDMTPMQYLRQFRLGLAREELLAAPAPRLSVRDVALRWGFAHPGRFAQQYAATFGEHPSATLRR